MNDNKATIEWREHALEDGGFIRYRRSHNRIIFWIDSPSSEHDFRTQAMNVVFGNKAPIHRSTFTQTFFRFERTVKEVKPKYASSSLMLLNVALGRDAHETSLVTEVWEAEPWREVPEDAKKVAKITHFEIEITPVLSQEEKLSALASDAEKLFKALEEMIEVQKLRKIG